jgi:hypothetical protein
MAVLTDQGWYEWYEKMTDEDSAALIAIIGAALNYDDGSA